MKLPDIPTMVSKFGQMIHMTHTNEAIKVREMILKTSLEDVPADANFGIAASTMVSQS